MSPLFYDLTHLSQRAEIGAPSGIDRVDLMFARAFAHSPALAGAVHYGVRRPSVLKPGELAAVVERAEQRWRGAAARDPGFVKLRNFLTGAPSDAATPRRPPAWRRELTRRTRIGRFKLVSGREAPAGAIYLNVAQHALERRSHFDWLTRRPDVKPVFFLHDLLPLDYPEFWPADHEAKFERRVATMFSLARGIVMSSETVADRVREELRRRGIAEPALFAKLLPSPLQASEAPAECDGGSDLAATPYFVVVGTVEPRKNHLALLNLWRAMIEAGERPPKLVIVGGRGWLNDETAAMLDRSKALKGVVTEASGLGDAALRAVLRHARALLAPSFAEGYGLPVVEALELGTAVIASDLPVFREIAGDSATLIEPLDGAAWRQAIKACAAGGSPNIALRKRNFAGVDPALYFDGLNTFLQSL